MHRLHPELQAIQDNVCGLIREAGGRALLVGGCVRDMLLGLEPKDLDIEVYGLESEQLVAVLQQELAVDLVGQDFGVIKLRHYPVDVSLPRRESRRGSGHRGFHVFSDPRMTPREAAARRDFTINAIAWDPNTQELIDPFGGERDLRDGVLRHTTEHFAEDPLRVLRGMQFVGRFHLTPHVGTLDLCRRLLPESATLSQERIWGEWEK